MPNDAVRHSTGAYRYLPAIDPYSSGVAAEPGYEILGLRFDDPPPVAEGFARLDRELATRGLPASALVGIELRSPTPFSFDGFDSFNGIYRRLLADRGLLEGDVNPIARTNVVPVTGPPAQPVLLSAFVVQPAAGAGGTDFVIAGSGEVDGPLGAEGIVARGDLSQAGLAAKAAFVLGEMVARLAALGQGPDAPTLINVYTAHELARLGETLARHLPAVNRSGWVHWMTRPPLVEVEFEMDLRKVSAWRALAAGATEEDGR
jgi:hypothetical protein